VDERAAFLSNLGNVFTTTPYHRSSKVSHDQTCDLDFKSSLLVDSDWTWLRVWASASVTAIASNRTITPTTPECEASMTQMKCTWNDHRS
jgi:hypothetical protein